jgi:competence ComEA-like helix-hairpin-helix protein
MPAWTPAERRGALLVAVLLALGAARDLWRAAHPSWTPAPPPPAVVAPGAASHAAATGADADTLVDLNRAGPAELDALPGIGPVLAGRILERRAALGGFRAAEDLLGVPGIGPRLFERLRPRVRVSVPPASSPR